MQTLEGYRALPSNGNLLRGNLPWPSPADEINAYILSLSSYEHVNSFASPASILNPPSVNNSKVEMNPANPTTEVVNTKYT